MSSILDCFLSFLDSASQDSLGSIYLFDLIIIYHMI